MDMTLPDRTAAFLALDRTAIVCALPELGCLRFDGAEAAAFLQGQLSSDVKALRPGTLQRSTYNSPKGRVLASLVLWRDADETFAALVAADLAAAIARRLGLFVLRAKVKVRDASAERVRLGVAGPAARTAVQAALGSAPDPGSVAQVEGAAVLALADGRFLLDAEAARAEDLLATLSTQATRADSSLWRVAAIRAGVPLITAATSDQFVPQALNLDVLGAVSFQKGCYPGQEIVARTQYLGRLKERLYAFGIDAPPPPAGTRLYAATFGDQACGTVVDAAPLSDDARSEVLAVVQRAAAEGDALHLGALDGPVLSMLPLPYAVPEPAAPRGRRA